MAQVKDNIVTEGFSGKLGSKIVFRQLGNRTVVAKRSRTSEITTPNQATHRQRFRQAAAYAKVKMLDPAAKAEYEAMAKQYELTSAFAAAVGDFLTPPDIANINTGKYSGQPGDAILITSVNRLKIVSLQVSILQPGGALLEAGPATFSVEDVAWKYVATVASAVAPGTVVRVVATDKPGNVTTKEAVL